MTVTQIVTCDGCGREGQKGEQLMVVIVEQWGEGPTIYLHFHNWSCWCDYGREQAMGTGPMEGGVDAHEA